MERNIQHALPQLKMLQTWRWKEDKENDRNYISVEGVTGGRNSGGYELALWGEYKSNISSLERSA